MGWVGSGHTEWTRGQLCLSHPALQFQSRASEVRLSGTEAVVTEAAAISQSTNDDGCISPENGTQYNNCSETIEADNLDDCGGSVNRSEDSVESTREAPTTNDEYALVDGQTDVGADALQPRVKEDEDSEEKETDEAESKGRDSDETALWMSSSSFIEIASAQTPNRSSLVVLETEVSVLRPLGSEILRSWCWSCSIGLRCFRGRSIINIYQQRNAEL